MIKGMPIVLLEPVVTGYDGFGRPIVTESEVVVENVLVAQPTTDAIPTETDLTGKGIEYVLGIPKGDTHDWKDKRVRFFNRTFRTVGYPIEGIEENVPLSWHKKVMVEAYE